MDFFNLFFMAKSRFGLKNGFKLFKILMRVNIDWEKKTITECCKRINSYKFQLNLKSLYAKMKVFYDSFKKNKV